ncbi:uncharacterized protein B0I36DRAFT_126570 [Microdochium trichocladiopsis]|uniref:Uncharacterized protein n=1 Tax=Microdochium trichocladiopsis TaxID=1682393 RepID=A0A9P8Y361_9PEZI|nr:uncharacterized protein B0I36DRAFT_126570 [Microdochium trichocladiopsis]KAH7028846.1 hypothetical protein B0I36DRAFT_126570 [Microdochium trichocladiopsis]
MAQPAHLPVYPWTTRRGSLGPCCCCPAGHHGCCCPPPQMCVQAWAVRLDNPETSTIAIETCTARQPDANLPYIPRHPHSTLVERPDLQRCLLSRPYKSSHVPPGVRTQPNRRAAGSLAACCMRAFADSTARHTRHARHTYIHTYIYVCP